MRAFHLHFGGWYPPYASILFNFSPSGGWQFTKADEQQGLKLERASALLIAIMLYTGHELADLARLGDRRSGLALMWC